MSGIKLGIRVAQINKTVPALKEVKANKGRRTTFKKLSKYSGRDKHRDFKGFKKGT